MTNICNITILESSFIAITSAASSYVENSMLVDVTHGGCLLSPVLRIVLNYAESRLIQTTGPHSLLFGFIAYFPLRFDVKMNGHENVSLNYRQLTLNDIPDTYGFDKYGLIVQGEFASITRARAATLHSTNQQAGLEAPGHGKSPDPEQISARTVMTAIHFSHYAGR